MYCLVWPWSVCSGVHFPVSIKANSRGEEFIPGMARLYFFPLPKEEIDTYRQNQQIITSKLLYSFSLGYYEKPLFVLFLRVIFCTLPYFISHRKCISTFYRSLRKVLVFLIQELHINLESLKGIENLVSVSLKSKGGNKRKIWLY